MKHFTSALACVLLALPLAAQDWPRFRGPNGDGTTPPADIPTEFTEKDYNWKAAIPGVGHSSPVVWGENIFLTSADNATGKRFVLALNSSNGKTLWTREVESKKYKTHLRNSFATSTPVVDRDRVYTLWATPEQVTAIAYSHTGELAWTADLGAYKGGHGSGVSPILVDDLLIVPNDQDKGGSVVALDAATGKTRWSVSRRSENATYSTPCLFLPAGKPAELILTNWQLGVTALDPKTGNQLWAKNPFDVTTQERAIASPVMAGDMILATCGFVTGKKEFVALRPGPDGAKEIWRLERAVSYMPTPLVKGSRVYLCSEHGIATCLDLNTGKEIWQERIDGKFSASPVAVGDNIFCISDTGDVFVLAAKDEFDIVGKSKLGEKTQSTPAIAGGIMYIRTEKSLISLGGKSKK